VERVVEYLDLPQEPPAVIESHRPPAYWPSSATNHALVAVENIVIKYAPDMPPVLHGVSFSLKAGERVGLLGRTGELLLCFDGFRMVAEELWNRKREIDSGNEHASICETPLLYIVWCVMFFFNQSS